MKCYVCGKDACVEITVGGGLLNEGKLTTGFCIDHKAKGMKTMSKAIKEARG